jgi:repressor LexA
MLKRHRIHQFLEAEYRETGRVPTVAEVARRFRISNMTSREHLLALAGDGTLTYRTLGRGRSPIITLKPATRGVPLIGDIAAGSPAGATADPEGYLETFPPNHFALRVRGDSMADRIVDGDVVILKRHLPTRTGEICAVRVDDDDTTLKYLDWSSSRPNTVTLRPHNTTYPTLTLGRDDVVVDGVFRGLLNSDLAKEIIVT